MSRAKTLFEAMSKAQILDLMDPGTVYVATVDTEWGLDVYVDRTYEGVYRKVADYCRSCWSEVRGTAGEPPGTDFDVIIQYFQHHPSEELDNIALYSLA